MFDLRINRCLYQHRDQGSLDSTAIGLTTENAGLVGVGSTNGVLNVYGLKDLMGNAELVPKKCVMNLTTT